jgi:hypothetical protein
MLPQQYCGLGDRVQIWTTLSFIALAVAGAAIAVVGLVIDAFVRKPRRD